MGYYVTRGIRFKFLTPSISLNCAHELEATESKNVVDLPLSPRPNNSPVQGGQYPP
jgi:hypothetical protein